MTAEPSRLARVLVVDDDEDVRQLVALTLLRAGFHVLEASSGAAALTIIETQAIALVVLDMVMPGMSGGEVVLALRAQSETATLPILLMTGAGDLDSVISGLDGGADDFVRKPVRLDELVARVSAHLRKQTAWSNAVEEQLRVRAAVVAALARLAISPVPEEAAAAVVSELGKRTDSDYVAVLQLQAGTELRELATYTRTGGVMPGGRRLGTSVAAPILARARIGPWVGDVEILAPGLGGSTLQSAQPDFAAGAPIYVGDDLVGILTIGVVARGTGSLLAEKGKILAAAVDYAAVLSSRVGPALADQRDTAVASVRLRQVLSGHQFHPVYQPILDLETRVVVGYEALTRFHDGTRPDIQFQEADLCGLGVAFEIATLRAALEDAKRLPPNAFLSVNVSAALVLRTDPRLRRLIADARRPIVLELTEHVPIADYTMVRTAIAKLGAAGLAVDDAGAGYASLRHILELQPTYTKLDISLVRGIERDELRQAMVAGLQLFAQRTGCRLIAEGVESLAEASTLQTLGIELGQGYLFGRPEIPVGDHSPQHAGERAQSSAIA
jgi:EAL domain-containing protein (putative c-di-GMP-specific phosphodiesterase class I)/CheY-like chemotaxis protein